MIKYAIVSQQLTLKEPSDTSRLTAPASDTMFQIDASQTMVGVLRGGALSPLNYWTWQDLCLERIKDEV